MELEAANRAWLVDESEPFYADLRYFLGRFDLGVVHLRAPIFFRKAEMIK